MAIFYRWIVEASRDDEPAFSWEEIGTVMGPWTEQSALAAAERMPQRNRYHKRLRVLKWETATVEQRYAAAYEDLMAEHLASGRLSSPDLHALARQEAEAPITPVRPLVGLTLRSVVVLIRSIPLIVGALVVFFLFRACS